jgi:hypothetical protein
MQSPNQDIRRVALPIRFDGFVCAKRRQNECAAIVMVVCGGP